MLGLFAPRVETALSGAGWEASGSQSAQARKLVERDFAGLGSYGLRPSSTRPRETVSSSPAFRLAIARVEQTLRANGAVRTVVAPAPGLSISRDGHTAIVQAGAARDPNEMVAAADRLKGTLHKLSSASGVVVNLTGAAGMWSDFNAANRSAMLKSEVDLLAGDARNHAARVRLARRRGPAADADHGRAAGGRRRRFTSAR